MSNAIKVGDQVEYARSPVWKGEVMCIDDKQACVRWTETGGNERHVGQLAIWPLSFWKKVQKVVKKDVCIVHILYRNPMGGPVPDYRCYEVDPGRSDEDIRSSYPTNSNRRSIVIERKTVEFPVES